MAGVTIHLHPEDGAMQADALTFPDNGESFICLTVSGSLSLILPGRDAVAVDAARAWARTLTTVADALAAKRSGEPVLEGL
jgi:hypothetical protein